MPDLLLKATYVVAPVDEAITYILLYMEMQ